MNTKTTQNMQKKSLSEQEQIYIAQKVRAAYSEVYQAIESMWPVVKEALISVVGKLCRLTLNTMLKSLWVS